MSGILVLHGPNLNLLGTREPEVYGSVTLAEIDRRLAERGRVAGVAVRTFQSNAEAPLIERIQGAKSDETAFIIINPAAFTHTSVALRLRRADSRPRQPQRHVSVHRSRKPKRFDRSRSERFAHRRRAVVLSAKPGALGSRGQPR